MFPVTIRWDLALRILIGTCNRSAIMRAIKIFTVALAFSFAFAFPSSGQGSDRFEGWCPNLQNAGLPELVQFLSTVVPEEQNARCVTWATSKLGKEHYEPAVAALVRLLDFHRP